ncbi:DUF3558 domain-containing protein [Streptomyces sp. 6N223]|uniref:DUF3558 domain-containing protein n=1 Tax=Streptomyces sp. 6N223 TaxID=3457412 RepID=UPI003FCEFA78
MQRSSASAAGFASAGLRAAIAAAAALAVGGVTAGCSGGVLGADEDTGAEAPPGAAASVEPGRFSALPEPCGAVEGDTLRELLPGGDDEAYEGEPMATFDTGRRVGCAWHIPAETSTRELSLDFERVISYDPAISDDDQAEQDFENLAAGVGVPLDGSDPGETAPEGDTATEVPDDGVSVTGEASTPAGDLASRPLDDIGHVAILDDQLTSHDAGASREVLVAFRSANVIVTVTYTVSTTVAGETPDSSWLQEGAQEVARQLAGGFDS